MAPYLFFYNVCCVFLMATTTTLPVLWGQQSSKQLLHPFVALWEHGDLGGARIITCWETSVPSVPSVPSDFRFSELENFDIVNLDPSVP